MIGQPFAATPRTVGGFVPQGSVQSGVLSFDVGDVPAVVTASSLDDYPVERSRRILLMHLTDVQADGRVYANASMRTLCEAGGRTLVRVGQAKIDLALDSPEDCQVWGLDTAGRRVGRVPAEVRNDRLRFTAEVCAGGKARLYYEIVKPNKENAQ